MKMFQYYRFMPVDDVASAIEWFQRHTNGLKGTVLIANEGINLSVAGDDDTVIAFVDSVNHSQCPPDPDGVHRIFEIDFIPYKRMKVRQRNEIITFKRPVNTDLNQGRFLTPFEFHERMQAGTIVPLDTRNIYEQEVGTFRGAVLWPIDTFSQLPDHLDILNELKDKDVVTFCTGGVRCEKVVPFLIEQGFTKVWQIKGGIQDYIEQYPDGFWQGDCFVFDDRQLLK